MQEVNQLIGAESLFTTAYHPQTNGQTERIMSILSTMLSMYVNRFHSNWSRLLNLVTFAYNTTSHSGTEMSSFKLLYEREPVFPKDMWFGVHIPGYEDLSEYAEYIQQHWPDLRDMAKAAMQKAQEVYTVTKNLRLR